jgi:ribose transport system ATP-binding protein
VTLLQLSGIRKSFGATQALAGVDLEVRKGEVHALIGENGAGKSTLLNILSGTFAPDTGKMRFEEQEYIPADPEAARSHGIAHIHQELSLCPHLSVGENILLGAEPARRGWLDQEALQQRALEVLRDFEQPAIRPGRRVLDLPLAARQVVEISRALAQNPKLILMDEPTSSLQHSDVDRLFASIRRLRDAGISVIYISHSLEEVREIGDRFTVLRDGASVLAGALKDVPDSKIITAMVGRSVDSMYPQRSPSATKLAVIEIRHLSSPPAVREASFHLYRGEVLGIAGLIGSGRTEMVRSLLGLLPAKSGEIIVGKDSISTAKSRSRLQWLMARGVGYLSEDRKGEGLALTLSIADNVTMTNFSSCSSWSWIDLDLQAKQTAGWLKKLGVKAKGPEARVVTLSGGNQQKIAMVRMLHQGASIILMDEPTRGVDVGSKAQIYEAIAEMAASGKSVLMVSSYLPELFGICDRLAVMVRGVLSPARPIGEWTPESVLETAIASTGDSPGEASLQA